MASLTDRPLPSPPSTMTEDLTLRVKLSISSDEMKTLSWKKRLHSQRRRGQAQSSRPGSPCRAGTSIHGRRTLTTRREYPVSHYRKMDTVPSIQRLLTIQAVWSVQMSSSRNIDRWRRSRRSEASGSPPCILRTPCAPLEDRHSILRPAHSLSLALHRQRSTEHGTTTLPHSPSTRLCLMRNEECDGPRCMASPLLQRTQATGAHPATRLSRQRPLPPLGPLRSRGLQGASRTQH